MATEAQKRANKKYREKGNRITLDFYPSETELWNHLQSQPNKQGYIKSLILADMEYQSMRYTAPVPPKGYKYNADHKLIVDEEIYKQVQEIFNLYTTKKEEA